MNTPDESVTSEAGNTIALPDRIKLDRHYDVALLQEEVFQSFDAEIASIRLMRLEAGAVVKEHNDPTLDADFQEIVRLTLPICSDDAVTFLLNGTEVPMRPGELWYMRLSDRHSVHNDSPHERINMSIDLVWNDWVERLLTSRAA
jgi:quercetin dioxygenase-like cupin family protein